ncbi:MAG: hypothetical protein U9Q76_05370 [candidate division WOR-3 bacterium]|nr:hypothetical protein [candidate division WOR-3 bacterium]
MAKKQIVKQIYIYAICVGIWGVVRIAFPQFTLPQLRGMGC